MRTGEGLTSIDLTTAVIYCLIFGLGIIGNGLVIYVTGFRMKKTVNSVWFLNLALADFLFTAFLIFQIISVFQGFWPFGQLMCKLSSFVTAINMFASIFLLVGISFDRCLSIWVVVWAQNHRTICKTQLICAAIWLISVGCSVPNTIFREVLPYKGKTVCAYSPQWGRDKPKILIIVRFILGFLIPFLIIFAAYIAIGVRAQRIQRMKKRRPFRIIFIILAFFVCWLPFHVFQLLEITRGSNMTIKIGGRLAVSLAFFNSSLNPLLYVFMCDEFQKKIKQSLYLVLEHAFAEDLVSFGSSRYFSRGTQRSDSVAPVERKDRKTSSESTGFTAEGSDDKETRGDDL
ncbi:chemokine-like receptor 1 [Thalassophryne amazonica]|uniref:chemokine-like receptor 1 n=1 Tax=Thalassophryne amazonica TaxID=390379 RepID=UPI0014713552|nr:chemokine-like receptor 1 [Thalassophryne amazonica]